VLNAGRITLVAGVIFLGSLAAWAQEADPLDDLDQEFELLEEEIVYSAAKHEQSIAESPATISTLTREQIENTHCLDVPCLLRGMPGMEIRRLKRMYTSVGARALVGEMGDKILVLIDGREINVDSFGMPYWEVEPIHIQDIERIEVIRGPGSALYGANAHSVVVSIETRKPQDDRAEAFLGAGEHDETSLHLRLDQLLGKFRLMVNGGMNTGGNWRRQDVRERELYRAGLRLERSWESSATSLDLGMSMGDGLIYSSLCPTWIRDMTMGHVMLSHRAELWRAHVAFNLLDQEAYFDMPIIYSGIKLGEVPSWISMFSTSLDTEAQLNWPLFEENLLIVGAGYRWLTYISDENDPTHVDQHRLSLFVQDEQKLFDQLILTAGVRLDYNSITPFTVSPRVAAVWRFVENQSARVAFGRAFRKPSFFNTSFHVTAGVGSESFPDLEDFMRRGVGNDDLGNESVTTVEAGYRGGFLDGALLVESDVFFSLYRDTIFFRSEVKYDMGLPDLSQSDMQWDNGGREVNSIGGTLSVTYRVKKVLRLNANYTYRYSWYISEPPGGASAGEEPKGERVGWEPAHLFNAACTWISGFGSRLGAAVYAQSEVIHAFPYDGGLLSEVREFKNPPNAALNAFLAWRFDFGSAWAEAGVRVYNLLNAGRRDIGNVYRWDGFEMGGELSARRIFLYLRGKL
jgi:outer membrane receptor for ferrienterochelin and colicin